MNVTTISTSKQVYPVNRSKPNAAANDMSEMSFYSEFPEKSVSEPSNDIFYKDLKDKAVSSAEYIAEQKEKYADMYVTSAAHRYYSDNISECSSSDLIYLRAKIAGMAWKEECMLIPIEAGELPQLMDTIQDSLKNGMSLADILKQKYDDHIRQYGEEGHSNSFADWFAINTSTGEVMSADPISRTYHGEALFDDELSDMEAVMELADDLATFLKYAVFSDDREDPEKVNALLSFIKNKQAYANYDRFLADGEEGAGDAILQRLIAAGVLKGDDEEEEKEESVDGLMEAIRIHQEELKEYEIDIEGSKKIISEIQEIIEVERNI